MLCTPPAQKLDPYSQDQDINASESANPKTLFNIWISGEALSFEGAYRWGSFRYFHPSNPVLVLLAFEDHLGNCANFNHVILSTAIARKVLRFLKGENKAEHTY